MEYSNNTKTRNDELFLVEKIFTSENFRDDVLFENKKKRVFEKWVFEESGFEEKIKRVSYDRAFEEDGH